jgi:hypothetical protein
LTTRKDKGSKARPKSEQSKSKPASDFPFRKERTEEEAARTVTRRRKALRAPAAASVSAILIEERNQRDDELSERIAGSVEGRRGSTAHVENDPGGARNAKGGRITVTLESDLIRIAQAFTGIKENSALIRTALTQLVEREAARRWAALDRPMPNLKRVARGRLPGK